MKARALLMAASWLAAVAGGQAVELKNRSDSSSGQFTVYSDDKALRQRVVSFVEEVKTDVLKLLGERGERGAPIVVTLEPAKVPLKPDESPVSVRLVQSEAGLKIEVYVKIGDEPAAVHLHKHIVGALLLEYSYRTRGVRGGERYVEPPWWIVEGATQLFRQRDTGIETGFFKTIVAANNLPVLAEMLDPRVEGLGAGALVIDQSLAMCLVQLLIDQPGGRESIARLIREWPQGHSDPVTALTSAFPGIVNRQTLQKWWTLGLARFATADRQYGLTMEETEQELNPKLLFDFSVGKSGERKNFTIADYEEFLKLPDARAALAARHKEIVALSFRANALFRPVLADYEQIFALLSRGKTRGMKERLVKVELYRASMLQRSEQIADYLNWFEATQATTPSHMFDGYFKAVREMRALENRGPEPIARYMDEFEKEYNAAATSGSPSGKR